MANDGMRVVGLSASTGEYEGHDYNNTYLHCEYTDKKVSGYAVTKVKVRTSVFMDSPCKVGDFIDTNCDTYGRVKEIRIIKQ